MPLRLRKVTTHVHATDAYRVIYAPEDGSPEIEVGSIGIQFGSHQRRYWSWGIDTVIERQAFATSGEARDREDAMAQFKAVWEVFISEPERIARFLEIARSARRW